jgi:hypothetical protein
MSLLILCALACICAAYVVRGSGVGTSRGAFYRGQTLPDDIPKAELKRLEGLGAIRAVSSKTEPVDLHPAVSRNAPKRNEEPEAQQRPEDPAVPPVVPTATGGTDGDDEGETPGGDNSPPASAQSDEERDAAVKVLVDGNTEAQLDDMLDALGLPKKGNKAEKAAAIQAAQDAST